MNDPPGGVTKGTRKKTQQKGQQDPTDYEPSVEPQALNHDHLPVMGPTGSGKYVVLTSRSSAPPRPMQEWVNGQLVGQSVPPPPDPRYRGPYAEPVRYMHVDAPPPPWSEPGQAPYHPGILLPHPEFRRIPPTSSPEFSRHSTSPEAFRRPGPADRYITTGPPTSRLSGTSLPSNSTSSSSGGAVSIIADPTSLHAVHLASSALSANTADLTEKEKMLLSRPFRHYEDASLIEDRDQCREAVKRFNEISRHPSQADFRAHLFREIVEPARLREVFLRSGEKHPVGSSGANVVVEAPFEAEYGYNIHLGDDVVVESGCRFFDAALVSIGDRCIVGPGVKFCARGVPLDKGLRQGSLGVCTAKEIVVDEDCFLGADVVVCGGVRIGRGSVVAAGCVVSQVSWTLVVGSWAVPFLAEMGAGAEANLIGMGLC